MSVHHVKHLKQKIIMAQLRWPQINRNMLNLNSYLLCLNLPYCSVYQGLLFPPKEWVYL